MLVLGLCGGPDLVHENLSKVPRTFMHDAAAVLIEDGKVLFAIEEERLNRIKHTNKLPLQAVLACLKHRGVQASDIDAFAFYSAKEAVDQWIKKEFLGDSKTPKLVDSAAYFQRLYSRALGCELDAGRFHFVHHHLAHAMSAFLTSGFESSLITTFDGEGDGSSGLILKGEGTSIEPLLNLPKSKSLGFFYDKVIAYLGYGFFDEYKVMGLAPYGDPERYRELFRTFYTLQPEGKYEIHENNIPALFTLGAPRRKCEPFSQTHQDIAAALQESLEAMAFHVIRHYQAKTKLKNLSMAGGVAHNCTLNGKILRSGLFEQVFVQPAAHDAGTALGAALWFYYQSNPRAPRLRRMSDVYWGTEIGSNNTILKRVKRWQNFIEIDNPDDVIERTAELLAEGQVVGWVQGRSEFGPRALGNRSILADPRPAENKHRINQMVKKREGYRPFAPSVLEESVDQFFEVIAQKEQHPFMVFVVKVRADKRELLGAVTHVDGTARIQTVSKAANQKYWNLIHAFEEITGIPMLLNTSFNNDVEPIVDSIEDGIVCFLTTNIDCLVVGDYLMKKRADLWEHFPSLKISLPPYVSLNRVLKANFEGKLVNCSYLATTYDDTLHRDVSPETAHILTFAGQEKSIGEILSEAVNSSQPTQANHIVNELTELWSLRLITCQP